MTYEPVKALGSFSWIALLVACGRLGGDDGSLPRQIRVDFAPAVTNTEYVRSQLASEPPMQARRLARLGRPVFFGTIMRRLPGEDIRDTDHFVPFAVRYEGMAAVAAVVDADMDGDLSNDPPAMLWDHPSDPSAKTIVADLRWSTGDNDQEPRIRSLVRIVLEPRRDSLRPPSYRAQRIHTMIGRVPVGSSSHLAFLMDGDGDGLYTTGLLDALYIDWNDDLAFDVSPSSREIHPLGTQVAIAGRSYRFGSLDPTGASLMLVDCGTADLSGPPEDGELAPGFQFIDLEERPIALADYRGRWVVLNFWATWCGTCEHQAPILLALYEKHSPASLGIVAISLDVDRSAVVRFRRRHSLPWPTSYSGKMFWEDPVGRAYGITGAGISFLVDPSGRIEGRYDSAEAVAARVDALLANPQPTLLPGSS